MAGISPPTFETPRLILRPITESDLPQIHQGLSDPEVVRYYGVSFETLEHTREQMTWYADLEKNGTGAWWAICQKEGLQFCGAGGLNNLESAHRKAEVGFWLLPEFWSQGLMQEAMPRILDYAFSELNLHRLEGMVETENQNSCRAIEKLGFSLEGTLQDCEIKDGRFISVHVYAKLKS